MESIWEKTTELPCHPSLEKDIWAEAAVIGGGMTGILTALLLEQKGVETVLLEADRVGSGQTCRTTAKITLQHNLIYDRLIRTFGKKRAKQYADANRLAIERYRKLAADAAVSCGLEERPAYLYSVQDKEKLERERSAAQALGIEAVLTDETELPFPVKAALQFPGQLQFHPLEFLQGIMGRLQIYEKTPVQRVEKNRVICEAGSVRAKHIVFACHYPFPRLRGFYSFRMYQDRSYVLALRQAQKLNGMYLGIDEGGYSLRNYGDYLLFGGAGHRTGENEQGERYELLRRAAHFYWPDSREEAAWSAQDCMTLDGVPYIGRFSLTRPNWYAAFGYGKWGMTGSMTAAMILSDKITGRENLNGRVFSPKRGLSAQAMGMLMSQIGYGVQGWKKRLFVPARIRAEDIPEESAASAQWMEKKAGIYKDQEGRMRAVCEKCPHLGCAVTWNSDEKSWDCPCHGSRFDSMGRLLDGPAQEGLEVLSDGSSEKR